MGAERVQVVGVQLGAPAPAPRPARRGAPAPRARPRSRWAPAPARRCRGPACGVDAQTAIGARAPGCQPPVPCAGAHPRADRSRLDPPPGGGTGANLYGQVSRWLALGHRVSIVAAAYEGSVAHERIGEPGDPPRRRALHGVPARDLARYARQAARGRRGARGGQRDHVPVAAVDAHAVGDAGAPRAPPALRGGDGPQGRGRGAAAGDAAAQAPVRALALLDDLQRHRGRDGRAGHRPRRASRSTTSASTWTALAPGERADRADAAVPGPAQALQADRGAAGRARADPRRRAGDRRRGRPPAGAGAPRSPSAAWPTACGCSATWTRRPRSGCSSARG